MLLARNVRPCLALPNVRYGISRHAKPRHQVLVRIFAPVNLQYFATSKLRVRVCYTSKTCGGLPFDTKGLQAGGSGTW